MLDSLRDKRIAIFGYGREGKSTHRYLLDNIPDIQLTICDSHPHKLIDEAPADTPCYFGEDASCRLDSFDVIFRSPGIPLSHTQLVAAKSKGVEISSLTQLFFETTPGITIGITGTKGKSTTAALSAHILNSHFDDVRLVGNIGNPALDYLKDADSNSIFVVELSSFQLEDLTASPDVSILLDIAPEHLDHHGGLDAYIAAKSNILKHQDSTQHAVLLESASYRAGLENLGNASRIWCSSSESSTADWQILGDILRAQSGATVSLENCRLRGPGNRQNILAAVACAHHMGVPLTNIQDALDSFTPLPHRMEYLGVYHGISFYNDSLATIPEASINALDGLGAEVGCIILGGHDRGVDYQPLAEALIAHSTHLELVLLFPNTGERIWNAVLELLGDKKAPIAHHFVKDMKEAVTLAFQHTPQGKSCILSPASSSLNMFRNYEERGNTFRSCIEEFVEK